jgi:hypothetical protein
LGRYEGDKNRCKVDLIKKAGNDVYKKYKPE